MRNLQNKMKELFRLYKANGGQMSWNEFQHSNKYESYYTKDLSKVEM